MSHPKNQHYVPRFILRNFLVNEAKEQVSVYDKHTDRVFTTSIDNIMAENRFHDFVFDGSHLSLEPAMTKLEQSVLPVYQRIIETRRLVLDKTPDEKAALAFLGVGWTTRREPGQWRDAIKRLGAARPTA